MFGAVVVGAEVYGFFVDVGQQFVGDARHADFGITHGCGVVAVYRAEVALAVYQHIAHGEVLRHAHDGVVYGDVAVRVVFTNHIADNTRRFFIRPVPVVV